jgi:RHS repeat-associated protein
VIRAIGTGCPFDLDELEHETTPQGVVDYTYDDASRRETMTVAGGAPYVYTYDDADQLLTITQGSSSVAKTYFEDNRLNTVTLPNGVVETYGYTAAGELQGISYAKGATSLGAITYTYDDAGRRMTRVSSADSTGIPAPVAAGTVTYNDANQLTHWGSQTIGYDFNGNMQSDGVNTFVWNKRNELSSMSGGSTASFYYDAFGRRRSKTIGGTSTTFQYDGLNIVRELNGAVPKATLWTGLGLDETYARTDASGTASLLTDGLNSTVALTNTSGTKTTGYTYDAYGNSGTTGAASDNSLQYSGRENDGTGLYHLRARYYNPTLGRFISSDPIGLRGGLNTYGYAAGNPVSFRDPLGLVTVVVVNNNLPGTGLHSGAWIGNQGDPVLYDPNGSYHSGTRGDEGIFGEEEASLQDYIAFQGLDGDDVQIYTFNTTPEEEAALVARLDKSEVVDPGFFSCAISTAALLDGIGPFKNLGAHLTPRGLGRSLEQLQGRP